MTRSKSMGIGSMFVLLVVAVVLLPMLVRYIDRNEPHFSISGFQDMVEKYTEEPKEGYEEEGYQNEGYEEEGYEEGYQNEGYEEEGYEEESFRGDVSVPTIGSSSKLSTWNPDSNTNYLCRSPNENGEPCEEGQFCDGTTQRCTPISVKSTNQPVGYYS